MHRQRGIEALLRTDRVALAHPDADRLRDRIGYAIAGPVDAPAVTLIPGGTGEVASSALTAVWRELAVDHRALVVETRGAPSVGMDPPEFSTRDLATDVVLLLDHLGLDNTYVVGASIGSMIGQHVAAELGERCQAAVLALSTAGGDPFFRELMHHLAHIARYDPTETPFATALWAAGGDDFDRWSALLPGRGSGTGHPPLEGVARRYRAAARHDARDRLPSLRARTLVVAAEDDLMLRPALGRALADQTPHATFEVWHGATHMCINEDPGRLTARCRAFITD